MLVLFQEVAEVASFPGRSYLQSWIVCSKQKQRGRPGWCEVDRG